MSSPNDPRAWESRYRDLLDRLDDMSERVERLERDRRAIVELLRDFRALMRLAVAQLKALDHRIENIAGRVIPSHARDERIARHFRN